MRKEIKEIYYKGVKIKEIIRLIDNKIEIYYFNPANNKCSFFPRKVL